MCCIFILSVKYWKEKVRKQLYIYYILILIYIISWRFPGSTVVKNSPANAGNTRYMGQEDALEEEMATHSSIFARNISWMKETGGLQSTGSQKGRT